MSDFSLVLAAVAPGLLVIAHPAWKVESPDGFVARFWMGTLVVCGVLGAIALGLNFAVTFTLDAQGDDGARYLPPDMLAVFLWWTFGLLQAAVAVWISALRHRRRAGLPPVEPTSPGVLFAWLGFGAAVAVGVVAFETTMVDLASRSGSTDGPREAASWFLVPAIGIPVVHVGLAVGQFFWFRAHPNPGPGATDDADRERP